ncbi:hypothetical protein L596_001192 [Steinernema carpocapsae]|uniref:Uncharacterized protein n=1 Tax=Steinernema carpocapsae TaxID=34508 RepID=A0A4U8UKJ6_STECR|nr:hypothetical protein L596_001192 [Steinernema carpocapsae]
MPAYTRSQARTDEINWDLHQLLEFSDTLVTRRRTTTASIAENVPLRHEITSDTTQARTADLSQWQELNDKIRELESKLDNEKKERVEAETKTEVQLKVLEEKLKELTEKMVALEGGLTKLQKENSETTKMTKGQKIIMQGELRYVKKEMWKIMMAVKREPNVEE